MALFTNDFEEGDYSGWTGTSTSVGETITVVHAPVHHNLHSSESVTNASADYAYSYKTLASAVSTLYIRVYAYLNALPAVNKAHVFLSGANAGGAQIAIGVWNTAGTYQLGVYNNHTSTWYKANITVAAQEWHCYEIEGIRNAAAGELHGWFDGVEKISQAGLDTGTVDWNSIRAGNQAWTNEAATTYLDCVVASATYVGVEAAGGMSIPVALHHYKSMNNAHVTD